MSALFLVRFEIIFTEEFSKVEEVGGGTYPDISGPEAIGGRVPCNVYAISSIHNNKACVSAGELLIMGYSLLNYAWDFVFGDRRITGHSGGESVIGPYSAGYLFRIEGGGCVLVVRGFFCTFFSFFVC
jgi:hypothetical protein